jgi:hypothetical protein
MGTEHMTLFEQGVDKSSLAMIDVGDYGNISDTVI